MAGNEGMDQERQTFNRYWLNAGKFAIPQRKTGYTLAGARPISQPTCWSSHSERMLSGQAGLVGQCRLLSLTSEQAACRTLSPTSNYALAQNYSCWVEHDEPCKIRIKSDPDSHRACPCSGWRYSISRFVRNCGLFDTQISLPLRKLL